MKRKILIVHDKGEEDLAELLAEPLRAAGYEVAHHGTLLIGEHVVEEALKILNNGGPIVLCGTKSACGSRWTRFLVNGVQRSPGVRVFPVQIDSDADMEALGLDAVAADYWQNPQKAMQDLVASLKQHYPVDYDLPRVAQVEAKLDFMDQTTGVSEYDLEALQEFRSQMREVIGAQYPADLSSREFLIKTNLMVNGLLTRAGLLMFGKDPTSQIPTAMVQCVEYKGVDRSADREPFQIASTIPRQIVRARDFIASRIHKVDTPSPTRAEAVTRFEYPMVCVREIIANALVHRDYEEQHKNTHIRLYADRIEVTSPGNWFARLLPDDVPYSLADLETESAKRNFRLACVLSWIKLVEGEGSGIPGAIKDCEMNGAPLPEIVQKDGWVSAIIRPIPGFQVSTIASSGTVIGVQQHIQPVTPPKVPLQKPPRSEYFIDREDALAWLLKELQPGQRVTLCGPGGIGKTALASEALWRLAPENAPPEQFPDGILWHSFYHQPSAEIALEALARAYGEEIKPNASAAARRALASRRALVVLDAGEAADNLDAVLAVTGSCGVLLTTRRHGDAPAGWLDLSPLPRDEAVALLRAWGGDWVADTIAAQRIADLFGGLPLALSLAGHYMASQGQHVVDYLAWLESTPKAALDFGERPSRNITLLMARSLEQVSELARSALGVTGVLALAPFDWDVVAAALGEIEATTKRALGELVDHGLLARAVEEGRWQVTHALVHAYARAELAPTTEVLALLGKYYDTFTREQRDLGLPGYRALDLQRGHILAVQAACSAAVQWDVVIDITWAAVGYLDLRGHWTERMTLLETGLVAAQTAEAHYDEGAFLGLLGRTYADKGDVRQSISYYEQALRISQEIGDRLGEGTWLGSLGGAYSGLGEVRRAVDFYEQALAISREIGDRRNEGNWLGNLGNAYTDLGEPKRAIELYEQALAISREIGDRRGEGADLGNLGIAYQNLGETRRAIRLHEQQLGIAREIGDRRGEGNALGNLGIAHMSLGRARHAIGYGEQQLVICREIGDRRGEADALANLGVAHEESGERARARALWTEALNIYEAIESPDAERVRKWLTDKDD